MSTSEIYTFSSTDEISAALNNIVTLLSGEAIARSDRCTVALSGGSLPKILGTKLKENKIIDWSKWHVFWADERCVPLDHEDSNYLLAKQHLLGHVPIPKDQIHTIDPNLVKDSKASASQYTEQLQSVFGKDLPSFDLILLGIGPDGHCCSLFPGHRLLNVNDRWVDSLDDSPKPPPSRITLTYPVVNNARNNLFVVTGEGKAETVQKILERKEDFPAGKGRNCNATHFLPSKA